MSDATSPEDSPVPPHFGPVPPQYAQDPQGGQYVQAPQYVQPQYQYPMQYGPGFPQVVARKTNGFAIASMVLGIMWVYWVGSILALIFGYIARSQIRENNEAGEGMAIAGIVLGWIGVGILLLVMLFGAIGALS